MYFRVAKQEKQDGNLIQIRWLFSFEESIAKISQLNSFETGQISKRKSLIIEHVLQNPLAFP